MAPLQHHFELAGWAETTIVLRFWLIAGMFVALGLWVFCRAGVAGVRGF
jgi:phospho-N-acetylmuramoyl-pentapeptide-transferase